MSRVEEVDDAELVVERIAALDLGKAALQACVPVPHEQRPGRRMQELRGYATTTAQLLEPSSTTCSHIPTPCSANLGPGYYKSRTNKHRRARDLATQLQALTGQHITIRDGKAVITDTAA
jgi:hypothetical protein